MDKLAALLPEVNLQPHQARLASLFDGTPNKMLLVHALGSGKSLTSIAAAEKRGNPYTSIVPASLRQNYRGELKKFTDEQLPKSVMSYTELASGKRPAAGSTLVFDEAHRLRNPLSAQTQAAKELADKADSVVLLTGSPIVNHPSDLAPLLSMVSGKSVTPEDFTKRYVGEREIYPTLLHRLVGKSLGREATITNKKELKGLLSGHVDYFDPGKPVVPTTYEDHAVEMSRTQYRIYHAMLEKIPWYLRWKLRNDVALAPEELRRTMSFMTGPRQVSLSPLPYMREKDPHKAYKHSPKLQKAMTNLQETLKDDRAKALVFSNYVSAGLKPYAAAMERAGIPHAVFHGGLSDEERKKVVDRFNNGNLRVVLLGPSGAEGLSFKGTQLVQLLDGAWNPVRPQQMVGRALRFDSHLGLPEDLQKVRVERYISRLPSNWLSRALYAVGFDQSKKQRAVDDYLLQTMDKKTKLNKQFVDLLKEVGMEAKHDN